MTHSFGIEIETTGASIAAIKSEFSNRGIKGCDVKPDGTPSVDAEIVLPPLADCQVAFEYLESVCAAIAATGATVNRSCGLHVHISNAPLAEGSNPATFTGDSIAHKYRTGRYLSRHGDPLDAVAVKDIMLRYTAQQDTVDSMLPPSRRGNRYCMPLNARVIEQANDLDELTRATHGKFSTINLTTFRGGSRVGVQYTMMRNLRGATTREIMDATGCSEQRVRAAVSEIRTRVGDAAVVTHTQQSNGARYGDGTDLTRYQVLMQVETQSSGATLRPENRRGMESIWAGLSDELFEYWNTRIIELR
jgi:hypothetical protein